MSREKLVKFVESTTNNLIVKKRSMKQTNSLNDNEEQRKEAIDAIDKAIDALNKCLTNEELEQVKKNHKEKAITF